MKYYEIVTIRGLDEDTEWKGFDLEEALKQKADALVYFERRFTASEKKKNSVDFRVYDLPDDIDINDEDAVFDAVSDCIGYDNF